ncbi:MAG TPA: tetratricopeptide repeat protein [Planctomycetota bacterium]|nr:tetratricopeptide repeat protein [Planctomycetota bacterium]
MDRTTTRGTLARGASGLLLLLLLAAPAARAGTVTGTDAIHRKTGDPIRGIITAESIDGIEIGNQVTIPIIAAVQIDYYDAPDAYKRGHDRRAQGIYPEAVRYFETAPKLANVRKFWIEPACLYYAGLCLLEEGTDLAAGEAKFRELLQAHPKSRFVPDGLVGLGRVHFTARRWDPALAQFKKLAELAAQRNGWEEWLAIASLWIARTYLEADRPDEAMRSARKVLDLLPDPKHDLVIQAKTVQGMVLLRQGEPEKAVALLRDLIKAIAPRVAEEIDRGDPVARMQRTESQCYNALGQAYLKLYAKSKKDEDLRQALLAFLWTVVLYPRAQFVTEHMEALHFASQCFLKLNQKARAMELQSELMEKYPDNPYNRVPGAGKAGAPRKETEK